MKKVVTILILFLISGFCAFAQVAVNTDNSPPNESAGLDVNFTNKGFLPPRMTTAQRNTIASPAAGLVIYNTDEKALDLYNGIVWNSMTPIPAFACGLTININHVVSGGVAPVNKTVAYGTVNGIPGELTKCWITRNLGASQEATVVSDATEASAGWYFQFNRKKGYQYTSSRTPGTAWDATNDNLSATWEAAKDPCALELGAGWHVPTNTEWTNVNTGGGWINWNGPFGSAVKLHAAGGLNPGDGSLSYRGLSGSYWSNTQFSTTYGWYLGFSSANSNIYNYSKSNGYPVRCVRDF